MLIYLPLSHYKWQRRLQKIRQKEIIIVVNELDWLSQGHTITTLDKQHDAINKIDELLSNQGKGYAHVSYADAAIRNTYQHRFRYFQERSQAKTYLALIARGYLMSYEKNG